MSFSEVTTWVYPKAPKNRDFRGLTEPVYYVRSFWCPEMSKAT